MTIELDKNKLNLMVAFTKNKRIYANNEGIPWRNDVKKEMLYVSKMTSHKGAAIIMGRLTHEDIGKPLPNRVNIVVSNTMEEKEGIVVKKTFDEAVEYCKSNNLIPVVFGGLQIYLAAMKKPCKFFVTLIDDMDYQGEKTFPENNIKLECVNQEVKNLLGDVEYDGEKFIENGVGYSFFSGEN